jgi:hypothetical protein
MADFLEDCTRRRKPITTVGDPVIELKNIIKGEAVDTAARLPFFDPATGEQIGTAPDNDP